FELVHSCTEYRPPVNRHELTDRRARHLARPGLRLFVGTFPPMASSSAVPSCAEPSALVVASSGSSWPSSGCGSSARAPARAQRGGVPRGYRGPGGVGLASSAALILIVTGWPYADPHEVRLGGGFVRITGQHRVPSGSTHPTLRNVRSARAP